MEKSYPRHRRLLRASRERPGRRAAEQGDERAAPQYGGALHVTVAPL